ncbi:hypothetical protein EV363DRAFT_1452614 [Boletus edulis]|nr:hypothetical protein EV363DRAFT_1452614 [Boletus edulis]
MARMISRSFKVSLKLTILLPKLPLVKVPLSFLILNRTLIEEELKKAELKWENKCFNVDSLQGNEEDYIVIPPVRSRDLGFLEDKRRMNVMLSRCKRGMVIFTNKAYIEKYAGPGKSLIGELTHKWYDGEAWIEMGDLAKTHIV